VTRRAAAGRVPAVEVLLGTPTVKELLLEGKTRDLPKLLEEGNAHYGSQTFNQSLKALVTDGLIDYDDALAAADSPDELKLAMRGIGRGFRSKDTFDASTPATEAAVPVATTPGYAAVGTAGSYRR
jgi:Tfp pilus assembly ATPase PilU